MKKFLLDTEIFKNNLKKPAGYFFNLAIWEQVKIKVLTEELVYPLPKESSNQGTPKGENSEIKTESSEKVEPKTESEPVLDPTIKEVAENLLPSHNHNRLKVEQKIK